jgi:hypothetical protein
VTHGEFRSAFGEGRIRVHVDRARAMRLMSARLMLPFILLPLFGAAVACCAISCARAARGWCCRAP